MPNREDEQLLDGDNSEPDVESSDVETSITGNPTIVGRGQCTISGLSPRSNKHPHVCGFSKIHGTCYGGEQTPFLTAKNLCTAIGARLCSVEDARHRHAAMLCGALRWRNQRNRTTNDRHDGRRRRFSSCGPRSGSTSMAKPTLPSLTTRPVIMFRLTTSSPLSGS